MDPRPSDGLKRFERKWKLGVVALLIPVVLFVLVVLSCFGYAVFHIATTPQAQLDAEDKKIEREKADKEKSVLAEKSEDDFQHGVSEFILPGQVCTLKADCPSSESVDILNNFIQALAIKDDVGAKQASPGITMINKGTKVLVLESVGVGREKVRMKGGPQANKALFVPSQFLHIAEAQQ